MSDEEVIRMRQDRKPRLFGLFGYPLSHTLSPAMQEAGFGFYGWKDHYLAFELDPAHFTQAMKGLPGFLLDGFNVTVPYKERVIAFLGCLTPKARLIGAVNTVYRRGGQWIGTNTDIDGFLRSLEQDGDFRPRAKDALLLGAGGAARAVACGLASRGVRTLTLTDMIPEKARALASHFKRHFPKTRFAAVPCCESELRAALRGVHLVVNATTVGLRPGDPALIDPAWIPRAAPGRRMFFYDLIYHPSKTAFLKTAAAKGHRTSNGLGMLLYQGTAAFEHWTGQKAPVAVMRAALLKALKEREAPRAVKR